MKQEAQIGQPHRRLEGRQKVTGTAQYAGEYTAKNLLYGYVVNSTIAKGKIKAIGEGAARAVPGIVEIFTHKNRPTLAWFNFQYTDMVAPSGEHFKPLKDNQIRCWAQPIALVVANTFEGARYAASLLEIDYEEEPFQVDLKQNLSLSQKPGNGLVNFIKELAPSSQQEDFEKAYHSSAAQVSGDFYHQPEHHNPMELFATTTLWEEGDKLTIWDKTQGTNNVQVYVGNVFGLHYKDVRVIAPFVGGAFGSGLRPQYQLFMSVMAALELKRPVRVTLDREQMFSFGHRPATWQQTRFAANAQGKLQALNHNAVGETSRFESYTENVVNWGPVLYPAPQVLLDYKLAPLDIFSPTPMRAPGGATGMHPIEVTMDMLACELNIDPLELRLLNYAERDEVNDKPFSSKELRECYRQGAEQFGWKERSEVPRSVKRGNRLVGMGMATGTWEMDALPARAKASFTPEGKLKVSSAVTDIGTGTLTVMTQIAADELGLPLEAVEFSYGDSKMPLAPVQGGSYTVGVVGSAVKTACRALRKKLLEKAGKMPQSLFKEEKAENVVFERGFLMLKKDPAQKVALTDIVAANGGKAITATRTNLPHQSKVKKYTRAAHSAAFVEVEVDEELGTVYVTRALTAVAAGAIINPKTARSQILGGMVWGISKALQEETLVDANLGRYLNQNLAEYHIPSHADIGHLEVLFVEEKDEIVNELGVKGVGEIGLVAMTPAIANAIYNATGKRLLNLPMHFNELIDL